MKERWLCPCQPAHVEEQKWFYKKQQKVFGLVTAPFEFLMRSLAPCGFRHSFPCAFLADAAVLNNVAHTFGLMDTVKKVLDNRKNQTEQGEEQFLYTLAGKVSALASHPTLGNQCDLSSTQHLTNLFNPRSPQTNVPQPTPFHPKA